VRPPDGAPESGAVSELRGLLEALRRCELAAWGAHVLPAFVIVLARAHIVFQPFATYKRARRRRFFSCGQAERRAWHNKRLRYDPLAK
jgi:hypothetical protein